MPCTGATEPREPSCEYSSREPVGQSAHLGPTVAGKPGTWTVAGSRGDSDLSAE